MSEQGSSDSRKTTKRPARRGPVAPSLSMEVIDAHIRAEVARQIDAYLRSAGLHPHTRSGPFLEYKGHPVATGAGFEGESGHGKGKTGTGT